MSIQSAASAVVEAFADWLNPEKREVRAVKRENKILRQAVEAADNLFEIQERSGAYKSMDEKRVQKYKIHWTKQWRSWKDGTA